MPEEPIPRPEGQPLRIVQLTDFHLFEDPEQTMLGVDTEGSFLAVVAAARARHWPVDLCLLTGDLAQDAHPKTYRRLKAHLRSLATPCYCLPGNHDEPRLIREHLLADTIFAQSHIEVGDWQIICLDSTIPGDPGGYLRADQMEILERQLSARPERHTVVALHHSPLPTGSQWLDTMRLANADQFLGLVSRYAHVKAIVCGHVHQEMDQWIGHMRLLACPSTCFQFKPRNGDFALDALPPGYRWLNLFPNGALETGVVRLMELPEGLDMNSAGY